MNEIFETERLIVRELLETDAQFILNLLNQPSFIKYIADRNVRTIEQARNFIENEYRKSYVENGFGMYAVLLKNTQTPIGICGFVKRDILPVPDLGFAFLTEFGKQGFAFEAASAMLKFGRAKLKMQKIAAVTKSDNENSIKLLKKLNFQYKTLIKNSNEHLRFYVR